MSEGKSGFKFNIWTALKGLFYLLVFSGAIGGLIIVFVFSNADKKPPKPWKEPTYASVRDGIKKMLERNHKASRDSKMATTDRLRWEMEYLRLGELVEKENVGK